jgi:hypothetical protein
MTESIDGEELDPKIGRRLTLPPEDPSEFQPEIVNPLQFPEEVFPSLISNWS